MKRSLVVALGLASVAIGIVSILVLSTLAATVALPLTDEGMIKKAQALTEVKLFQSKYPNSHFAWGSSNSSNADGYVDFSIGDWAVQDKNKERHESARYDNRLQLSVFFNRTSGEVVQISLDCSAYAFPSHMVGWESGGDDPTKSFHYSNIDIVRFMEEKKEENCFKQPPYSAED